MKIAIGCDHGGYELKEKLKKFISEDLNMEFDDFGTYNKNRCDYSLLVNRERL